MDISEEYEHTSFIYQKGISEAWEDFYKIFQAHRAQKDITEALEQFYSSKSLSEAYRAILTNHSIILALSNRCVQQGYKGKTNKQNKQRYKMLQAKLMICDE